MKAISIRQPWATLIAWGIKDVENRTWATSHRGPLLIHASKTANKGDIAEAIAGLAEDGIDATPTDFPTGAIIGIVDLVGCADHSDSAWFDGPVAWLLDNARECNPVPMSGRLGLFDVDLVLAD